MHRSAQCALPWPRILRGSPNPRRALAPSGRHDPHGGAVARLGFIVSQSRWYEHRQAQRIRWYDRVGERGGSIEPSAPALCARRTIVRRIRSLTSLPRLSVSRSYGRGDGRRVLMVGLRAPWAPVESSRLLSVSPRYRFVHMHRAFIQIGYALKTAIKRSYPWRFIQSTIERDILQGYNVWQVLHAYIPEPSILARQMRHSTCAWSSMGVRALWMDACMRERDVFEKFLDG
ncbi:hypothetical protein B0H13DRAFT_2124410 [Mycena leptocephala]|nr:hypothetical protein B0H13DRAFT_2124410 [Mycena leptocephala]